MQAWLRSMNRMHPLLDAHNHLQDPRLDPWREEILVGREAGGVGAMVVNGTREADWKEVATLAEANAWITPSFGLHPWWVRERGEDWLEILEQWLDRFPQAAVGEIGLDRWVFRVVAYAALMTDDYPPFRLDQGADEPPPPPTAPLVVPGTAQAGGG